MVRRERDIIKLGPSDDVTEDGVLRIPGLRVFRSPVTGGDVVRAADVPSEISSSALLRGQFALSESTTVDITQRADDKFDDEAYSTIDGAVLKSETLIQTDVLTEESTTIVYTGDVQRRGNLQVSASFRGINSTIAFGVFRNGELLDQSPLRVTLQGSSTVNASTFADIILEPDDILDVKVANLGGTGDPTVRDFLLSISD